MSGAQAIIKYETTMGEVELSPEIVKKYLVNGDGNITDQEMFMFLNLCKYQKLNPFLREAYLIKYGTQAATIVTGKETFLKRASRNPKYKGHTTGVSDDGKKAWAEVYVDGYVVPIRCEVDWSEYVGKKRDGSITKMWQEKGRTMLKKVALVQALREAFPEDFGGLYSPEEINSFDSSSLPTEAVQVQVSKMPPRQKMAQVAHLKDKLMGPQDKQEAPEAPPLVMDAEEVPTDTYITEGQGKDIMGQIKASGVDAKSFLTHFGISRLGELKESQLNEVYDWILDAGKE